MTDERFFELCKYEKQLENEGVTVLGGVDEVGRGPLAGPVVAACVILPSRGPFPRADDSKKLSEKKREELFNSVIEMSLAYGVGIINNNIIDEINILQATYKAMQLAVSEACKMLGGSLDVLLVDHEHIPCVEIKQLSITHGDALSVAIASSSIIAKVTRDRLMRDMALLYPEYGFEKNKGYGTAAHYEAIKNFGICEIHRKSFLKKVL